MSVRFQTALETLYGLERRKDKLGLEGTRALLAALGDPHTRFRSVHVAGTNGKGSVCALIERVLRESGLSTGLYTSPHLVDFRERIRVNGQWADESRLEQRLDSIQSLPEGRDRTFFEVATALGFDDFAFRRVEWAVVEVGLGGRLDCTNVITPDVCVITSIGLDHTEILGDTLEQIAFEKAGIIKPGVPVVVGSVPDAARVVIREVARDRGARVIEVAGVAAGSPRAPMLALNHATARAALDVLREGGLPLDDATVAAGFAAARWPGRFEACPGESRLWWDGAHNPDGAVVLAAGVREASDAPRFGALVLAASRDKNVEAMLAQLESVITPRRLIATRSHNERALDPETIAALARSQGWKAETAPDVPAACRRALALAAPDAALLTGSLFAVGEAMAAFGGAPGEWL